MGGGPVKLDVGEGAAGGEARVDGGGVRKGVDLLDEAVESDPTEREKAEAEPPEKVRERFLKLLDETNEAEERLRELLVKGGYLDE